MNLKYHLVLFLFIIFNLSSVAQTWTQVGSFINGEAVDDRSGSSVSLSSDGSTLAIGSPQNDGNGSNAGHVRIYKNISGTWTQVGSDIDGEAADDRSGCSVSLSSDGSTVAIGAYGNDGNGSSSGHVRIYKNISGTWTQVGSDIDGAAQQDDGVNAGRSVSLSSDGTTVAFGQHYHSLLFRYSGSTVVYKNISGTWTRVGLPMLGEAENDRSGESVSLSSDGSTVAIGAKINDGTVVGSHCGHVRIYKNISGTWTQVGSDIDGEAANDYSGQSVSLSSDGSIVAIGAADNDGNGSGSGHVRIYKNISGTWTQQGLDIDGKIGAVNFGWSVSLSSDGSTVAIGAYNQQVNRDDGPVRIYKNISGTWTQVGSDLHGGNTSWYGWSVSLNSDGSTVAVGAPQGSINGRYAGMVEVFSLNGTSSVLNTLNDVSINLYPNPTSDAVHIHASSELIGASYRVITSYGSEVLQGNIIGIDTQLDLRDLAEGVYFINVGDKMQRSFKVMKK
jgi:Flp pilus assembly pilin Flp